MMKGEYNIPRAEDGEPVRINVDCRCCEIDKTTWFNYCSVGICVKQENPTRTRLGEN